MEGRSFLRKTLMFFALGELIGASSSTAAVEIPKGCPLDHMPKVCEAFREIKNTDVLVFADGTKIPGCMLRTANRDSTKNNLQNLERSIFNTLNESKAPYPREGHYVLSDLIEDHEALRRFAVKQSAQFAEEVNEFTDLKNRSRLPSQPLSDSNTYHDDFEFALTELKALIVRPKFSATPETINRISMRLGKIKDAPPEDPSTDACLPDVDSIGFDPTRDRVELPKSFVHYPRLTRLRILGHELAHSFDPCQVITTGDVQQHPFAALIMCIRDDVGRFKQADSPNSQKGWCYEGHTKEAFCDYFGGHLVEMSLAKTKPVNRKQLASSDPKAINLPPGFESVFFDLDNACLKGLNSDAGSTHPSPYRRLKEIYMRMPSIAKSLGCKVNGDEPRCDIFRGTVRREPDTTPTSPKSTAR